MVVETYLSVYKKPRPEKIKPEEYVPHRFK